MIALVVALQVPFIYRRWEIGRLSENIAALNTQRTVSDNAGYRDYKGVVHVHTSLGGHSTGSFDELIAAARTNDLDFVVLTEHYSPLFDTSKQTLNGVYGKTLFIGGTEADANDGGRYLVIPGIGDADKLAKLDSAAFLREVHSRGLLAINNYPDRNRSASADLDGMEVYSLHINGKAIASVNAVFDMLWSYGSYPEATLATYFRRNDAYLQRYDAIAANRKLVLDAGTDAHSNKGYHFFADEEGHSIFGVKLDPYDTIFRLVRTHTLLPAETPLDRVSFLDAFGKGHSYVGFDSIGDTTGFFFGAGNGSEMRIMGDEIPLAAGVRLYGRTPVPARIVLLKNGIKAAEAEDTASFEFSVAEPGTYRVEVYLDRLGPTFKNAPWIMSNPIYVR